MSLLASAAAEPSAVFWRVLGGTKAEANEVAAPARSCSRGGRLAQVRRQAPPGSPRSSRSTSPRDHHCPRSAK